MKQSKKKPEVEPKNEDRGSLGNTGQFSRAAYNRGGLGAGMDGTDRSVNSEGSAEAAEEAASPPTGPSDAAWSRRGYGPRGYAGGFAGHEYDWTTRGEKQAKSSDEQNTEPEAGGI